ncbi:PulJ/GspJ family protein [Propionivibrio sp.]|uniref:PulJ/GspJ family protein n=1 Tax=Propionivibrio sp. TaxID=2212460 RepID=UPI003BF0081D
MIRRKSSAGFTLVEMIMVIVITGIIAGMIAVFINAPMEGYFSSVRRAALSEEADAALRFVARDLQSALPNSITCTSSGGLQFLAIRSGGRFREAQTGTPLRFGTETTGFDMIGGTATSVTRDARGNSVSALPSRVIVGNLSSGVANCHSDFAAFGGNAGTGNAGTLSSIGGGGVVIDPYTYLPECYMASPIVQNNSTTTANEINDREFGRVYIVDSSPVNYVCNTTDGLTRNVAGVGTPVVAASHLSACQVACDSTKARVQLITINLTLRDRDNEPVNMLRRVTIVNRP